ncbi:MAG: F0F1 ATP synthase subunit epsilon [Hyphomicrobiales bacterium]|nr:F0F1 ATP synthase subunit epsilon [Hyphomicrobiales bacterium]OQW85352.1 MAG: F0F1 ATP synthase subunit epsilon [Proteobacteria bacterium ST_bin15]
MADAFKFELVSPERLVLAVDARSVVVPGSEGEMTVLARHAPLMSTLRPGVLVVEGDGGTRRIFVGGGFAEVGAQGLTILAEDAVAVEDIDRAKLEQDIRNGEEDVRDAKSEDARRMAMMKVERLKGMAAVV